MAGYKATLVADSPKVSTRDSSALGMEMVTGAITTRAGGFAVDTG